MTAADGVALVVDIGATKMAVGLMTMHGELIDREQTPVDHDLNANALYATLDTMVQSQLERARDHHQRRAVAVGIGSAGPLTPNAEEVSPLNIGAWRKFPLRQRVAESTGLPVYADLDAKALALAEGWLGAAIGHDNFLAMVVSTGIGGGIVLNG